MLTRVISSAAGYRRCRAFVRRSGPAVYPVGAGVHADPRREEHRDGDQAGTEYVSVSGAAMQLLVENAISKFPQVAFVFSRTGTPDLAADPMPPSSSDTYIIVKPQKRMAGP